MRKFSKRHPSGRRNFLAICVALFSVAVLHGSFDTLPAGEDVSGPPSGMPESVQIEMPVPLPAAVGEDVIDSEGSDRDTAADANSDDSSEAAVRSLVGGTLDSMDTLKFCTLMLQDGARFMEEIDNYTVVFHKQERINGDLQEQQSIDMKVQHKPHFAVYMKWKNFERGRQVLFSEKYEDGCMVVKFGGFKRILPALKLEPNSSNARAESRYPVTQAGILGMIRQIVVHRQQDLKRGHGVECVRLPDQEFDQRRCYVFLLTYEDPKFCETYRKSIVHIDARHHIPLMIRNYTWATDAEGLTEAELDVGTLIEHYSFTGLDVERKLVANDFSRENPRYRM